MNDHVAPYTAPAGQAVAPQPGTSGSSIMSELKVSGHLMALDAGLYCITHAPSAGGHGASGLPGVRISTPPQPAGRPDQIDIASFRPDGYLHATGDAALVRVRAPSAQVLVTIYQSSAADGVAPNIQVRRLIDPSSSGPSNGVDTGAPQPAQVANGAGSPDRVSGRSPTVMELVAHIQERADVGAMLGEWLGERGSKRWIEGFGVMPHGLSPADVEYQAVLGRGWLSPWVEGGQFCGSRGMALPVLGIRLRLRGAFAETHEISYSAAFLDGTEIGPVSDGEPCESDALSPMVAFQIVLRPLGEAAEAAAEEPMVAPSKVTPARTAAATSTAAKPIAKPPAAQPPAAQPPAAQPPAAAKVVAAAPEAAKPTDAKRVKAATPVTGKPVAVDPKQRPRKG